MSDGFPRPTSEQLAAEQDLLADEVARWLPEETDLGRVLHVHRDWPPPWPVWVLMLGIGLPVFAVTGQPLVSNLVLYVAIVVLVGLFVFSTGLTYQLEVRERAVVVSTRFVRLATHVLPLWSIDPSRVRLHHNSPAMQLRTHRGDPFGGFATSYRTAIYSRRAVSLEGLDCEVPRGRPHDRVRLESPSVLPGQRVLQVGGPGWRVFGDPRRFGLSAWVSSARRPEPLLAAIEQALVASGRESARGLAQWVLDHPVVENRREPLTEDEVYGAGPSPYPWFRGPEQPGQ